MNKSYKSETKKGLIGLGAMVVLGAVVIGAANPVYQSLSKIGRKKGTESIYQPGTYEASAKGFAGDVKVVLTVTDKDIETLNVTGEQETPEFGGKAIAELPLLMLKEQTAEVDAVAGATITSDAIKKAVNLALAEARGEEIPEETTVAETETESAEKVTYAPGTYEGSAKGFGGEVKAEVVVTEAGIESIKVTGDSETPEIGGKAMEELPAAMVEKQSIEVDAIAGATITSDAVKEAVKAALAGAGKESAAAEAEETTEAEAADTEKAAYAPGTYEGSAKGFGGEVKAEVVVTEAGIESIKVTGDSETPEIGGKAMEELPAAMVEKQSTEVDAIAGATVTSDAVKEAVKAALEAAKQ